MVFSVIFSTYLGKQEFRLHLELFTNLQNFSKLWSAFVLFHKSKIQSDQFMNIFDAVDSNFYNAEQVLKKLENKEMPDDAMMDHFFKSKQL